MSLADEDAGMMDGLSQSKLEYLSLETTFQEIFDFQTQHVIELHAGFIQHSNTDQTTEKGITCKIKFCIFRFERSQEDIELIILRFSS